MEQLTQIGVLVAILTLVVAVFQLFKNEKTETNTAINTGTNNGIVAGKIENIEINQKIKRKLDQGWIDYLEKKMPPSKEVEIQLFHLMGDVEAREFAIEVQGYLLSKGWRVKNFIGTIMPFGQLTGISTIQRPNGVWQINVLAAS